MASNRRRHKRLVNLSNVIGIRYRCGLRIGKRDALSVENISGGGIRLCLAEKLKVGTRLSIEIRLLGEKESLPAKGEVAWVYESETKNHPNLCFDAGIRFIEIDPFSVYKIYNYFRDHNLNITML
ncbi:MAG: PilZ domain-containing protein [Candidatus Omnitrophota bacterium]|nr:PilZ domain-containing protein [Candidatus Omnitrophota bacterium]